MRAVADPCNARCGEGCAAAVRRCRRAYAGVLCAGPGAYRFTILVNRLPACGRAAQTLLAEGIAPILRGQPGRSLVDSRS